MKNGFFYPVIQGVKCGAPIGLLFTALSSLMLGGLQWEYGLCVGLTFFLVVFLGLFIKALGYEVAD